MSSTPEVPGIHVVLDPACSAVVEACAGSGKTWLLAARIVRLLLAGAQPAEILAITFTRKAAREIEERVLAWLRLLATAPAPEAIDFLAERGVANPSQDPETLARARNLYERLTASQPGLAVNTFHGWFLQLVAVAPLSANLAGTTLAEDGSRRFDELWQTFAARLQREPSSEVAQAFVRLLADVGQSGTKTLVRNGMARRAEWLACTRDEAEPAATLLDALRMLSGAGDSGQAVASFFASAATADARICADLFLNGNKTESGAAQGLLAALDLPTGEACFDALCRAALTADGTPRKLLANCTDAMSKRLGAPEAAKAVAHYNALAERLIAAEALRQEERNLAFNRDALLVHQSFIAHLEAFKAERRQIDFVDAEWRVLQLLSDESSAAFIQARLDARYRHVLLDEFQDTNPLQWQILLAWLDAYTDAARPTVFLVGDPKQSIYRFRRAEPRLFATASAFLQSRFGARFLARDETRRNAPAIIDVVNALFADEPAFQPFRQQHSHAVGLPGRVELLPLCAAEVESEAAESGAPPPIALRNPLHEAASEAIDGRRRREAAQLAARLGAMLGQTLIREHQGSREIERPLRCGDVLLLVRTRTQIAVYEQALAAAGIPFVAASRGGLLESLEVRDIVALLEFLVTPAADLQLAHALKSPLFACSDGDLLALAARPEAGWWPRLLAAATETGVSAPLRRAAALIAGWVGAAAALPAHDLLDRIFHEGKVIARYRRAVPEARCAAALANLEALLLLSLDLDGGRYPSLPRFIDELKVLRRAEGDDAPDEGDLAAAGELAADGRVRIMTIHGAKGLEAPLVWLLDANGSPRRDGPWEVLVEWPPEAAAPSHFSFVGSKELRGTARAPLFEAEAAAAEREELNLLYVAVTRAKQLFFASGVLGDRSGAVTPYTRLQAALNKLDAAGEALIHGQPLPEAVRKSADTPSPKPAAAPAAVIPVGERREMPDAAARFGILLHALLERRTEGRDEGEWWRAMDYSDADMARVFPVAERLLAAPDLQRFFDPALYRRAWNEMELTDTSGAVCRLDRLVEDDAAFWVLDYKSSGADTPRIDEYRAQVAGYCRAVARIFSSKPVRGALVFADASVVEVGMEVGV
jgi:ATP-dependent helicase/nuclease subunit A